MAAGDGAAIISECFPPSNALLPVDNRLHSLKKFTLTTETDLGWGIEVSRVQSNMSKTITLSKTSDPICPKITFRAVTLFDRQSVIAEYEYLKQVRAPSGKLRMQRQPRSYTFADTYEEPPTWVKAGIDILADVIRQVS